MLPYMVLAVLLLTAILLAQQASRLTDVLIYTDLPLTLLGGIGAALLPGVLTFSIPLAALAGIIIGYSRMGSDSEIGELIGEALRGFRLRDEMMFRGETAGSNQLIHRLHLLPTRVIAHVDRELGRVGPSLHDLLQVRRDDHEESEYE